MDINIINIDNFDITQIKYSKSFFIGSNKKKISIGYGENTDFHLLTPLFTNTMDFLSNHKYQYLKMIFDPMLGNILKFYNIIQSIELSIKDHILKHNKQYTLQSVITNDQNDPSDLFIDEEDVNIELDNIKNIYLKLTNNQKIQPQYKIYDSNCTECSLSNLKDGWKFKGLIRIESIWIDTIKKKFGLNLELVQLKILQPIVQTKCLIDNDIVAVKKEIYRYSNNTYNLTNSSHANIPSDTGINLFKQPDLISSGSILGYVSSTGTGSGSSVPNSSVPNTEAKGLFFVPPNSMELLKMKNALKKVLD
jgi:hypothetical protein